MSPSISSNTLCAVLSSFSRVWLFATLQPARLLSMGLSRLEYWHELPCPLPGDLFLFQGGIELASSASPTLQLDSLPLSHWGSPWAVILIFKTTFLRHTFYFPVIIAYYIFYYNFSWFIGDSFSALSVYWYNFPTIWLDMWSNVSHEYGKLSI